MRIEFRSNFRDHLHSFLSEKRNLGFKYQSEVYLLKRFDAMCLEHFPDMKSLTKEIGEMWATILPTEKRQTLMHRIGVLREFTRYLIRIGVDAYLVEQIQVPPLSRKYPVHIFTDEELTLFFAASDRVESKRISTIRHIIVPAFFRLMYCCGLRSGETRLIRTEDIDVTARAIKIRESKGHKNRLIVMSEDVTELCGKYSAVVRAKGITSDYFFPNIAKKQWCSAL